MATLALMPMTASAATLLAQDATYSIGYAENEFFGDLKTLGGAGGWEVNFIADTDPVFAEASATIGRIVFQQFTGLTMSWLSSTDQVLQTIAIAPLLTALSTVFTAPNLAQTLRFDWTGSNAGAGFDFEVAAAVPVPAAGLLLLTALGGAAAMRRRKKAAAA